MPGDRVTIEFYTSSGEEINEISGERTIDREGNIFLPYVGTVGVEGLDAVGIRLKLERLYEEVFPSAVVGVEALLRISVTGSVRAPNVYYVDPTTTLLQAIAQSGGEGSQNGSQGFSRGEPDLSQVRLVRGDSTVVVDLTASTQNIEMLNRRVASGDWLYVPTVVSPFSLRENVTFWGSVISLVATIVLLVDNLGN